MVDLVGQQLGNYRLSRLLGRGGFADVYLGDHIHLHTQAAIKVLRAQLSQADVSNFQIEARTIAHLIHPNIIQVLDFGVEGVTPFLVMVYAPNGTLRQHHPHGQRVPVEKLISYTKQLAAALQYAHDQKLIHRDVKPENMLVGRNNEILLSDFGIALNTSTAHEQSISARNFPASQGTWNPVGTVTYMAPEQIQGKPTAASDQYALGVVVYEWICGQAPFTGTYVEIAVRKMSFMPERGSLLARVPDLPPDVENVVLTALNIDPQRRFKTILAFVNALEQAYNSSSALSTAISKPAILIGPEGRTALKSETIAIGRNASNQVVLKNDAKASSRHAELRLVGKNYALIDLASTNGTILNGNKLEPHLPHMLETGDIITIGATRFTYEAASEEQRVPKNDGSTVRASDPASTPEKVFQASNPGNPSPVAPLPQPGNFGVEQKPAGPGQPQPGFTPYPVTPLPPVAQPPAPSFYSYSTFGDLQNPPAYTPGGVNPSQPGFGPLPGTPVSQPGGFTPVQVDPAYSPGAYYGQSGAIPRLQNGPITPMPPVQQFSQPGFQPFVPTSPQVVPPASSSRKRMLTIVSIVLVVLLIAGGFIVYALVQPGPTPSKTLAAFCSALLSRDTTSAWNQLTPQFQNTITQPIFNAFFASTSACTPGTPAQDNNGATSTLALTSSVRIASDNLTLTRQNNGSWQIASESGVAGLVQTLGNYCAALQKGDYTTAYLQFSTAFQTSFTLAQFMLDFTPHAATCSYSGLSMSQGGAQITISATNTTGSPDNTGASLSEANDSWKISAFTNLPEKVLLTFCTYLQSSNYQGAYNLSTDTFQTNNDLASFSKVMENFSNCSAASIETINSNLASEITFSLKTGGNTPYVGTLALDKTSGKWEIDSLDSYPLATLSSFCSYLQQRNYPDAYQEFTPSLQAGFSEQNLVTNFSDVTNCEATTYPQLTDSGTATAQMRFTLTGNTTRTKTATLSQLGSTDWKIASIG